MNNYKYPVPFEELIELLKGFPGIGRKSAERMALSLLSWSPERVTALGKRLSSLRAEISNCPECGNLSSGNELCQICSSSRRDHSVICVVEDAARIVSIEKGSLFNGVYHVLGGKLSPLSGKHVEDLNINSLLQRVKTQNATELILALSHDVEGQATSMYLAGLLREFKVKVTRPARGLPAGSDIAYVDSATIAAAFNGRIEVDPPE